LSFSLFFALIYLIDFFPETDVFVPIIETFKPVTTSKSARRKIYIAFLAEGAQNTYKIFVCERKFYLCQPDNSMMLAFPVFRKNSLATHLAFSERFNGK
jgi:hypothetical protein